MAGINNFSNFNLRNSLFNGNSRKVVVKTEKQETDVKPVDQQQAPTKLSVNNINKDSLLANNGIKIIRPGQQNGQPTVKKMADYTYSNMKDYEEAYYAGKFKPGDRISITEDYGKYYKITVIIFPEDGGRESIESTRLYK